MEIHHVIIRGLEEAANMTIIKITWLATCVPAFLKLRHRVFNPLVPGTFQPLQDGCETWRIWNESLEQTFLRRLLTVLREKVLPLCRNLLSPFYGWIRVPSKSWDLPTRLQGFTLQKILTIKKKITLQKMRTFHLTSIVRKWKLRLCITHLPWVLRGKTSHTVSSYAESLISLQLTPQC